MSSTLLYGVAEHHQAYTSTYKP